MTVAEGRGPREVAGMVAVLGYAQLRTWTVGALGGPSDDPEQMVRLAVRQLEAAHQLGGLEGAAIAPALIARLRATTGPTIRERTRSARMLMTPWLPSRAPIALGDGAWLDAVTDAGGLAVPLSLDDPAAFAAAVRMIDYVQPRIETARRRRTEDTRPIRRPAGTGKGTRDE